MPGTEFVPLPLESIPSFELDADGTPCYIGQFEDVCRHLEANGLESYYVLALEKREHVEKTQSGGTSTTVIKHPQIFFVTQTIAYRSVTPVPPHNLQQFDEITSKATFSLPKIPLEMQLMLDDFFRAVDRKNSTEAIVLLTFDPTIVNEDGSASSEGWGILVPEQENTSVHCNYEPDSVMGEKPFEAYIVGTVHSHPKMPAYASNTDHDDQADFDGLHITYGWEFSKNNGATQHYAELQINGVGHPIAIEHIFDGAPARVTSPEVEQWIEEKVKKKTHGGSSSTHHGSTWTSNNSGTSSPTKSQAFNSGSSMRRSMRLEDIKGLPADAPSYEDNVIIGRLTSGDEGMCPFCRQPLISQDRIKRRCTACHSYLALPGEGVEEVFSARHSEGVYTLDISTEDNPPKAIWMWERDGEGAFTEVYTPGERVTEGK